MLPHLTFLLFDSELSLLCPSEVLDIYIDWLVSSAFQRLLSVHGCTYMFVSKSYQFPCCCGCVYVFLSSSTLQPSGSVQVGIVVIVGFLGSTPTSRLAIYPEYLRSA